MRVFIAIRFSRAFQRAVESYLLELKRLGVKGSYTRAENLHLTLAFIGETDRVGAIREAVAAAAFEPFEISLRGTGRFGDLLWAGTSGREQLQRLADRLRGSLSTRNIRFDAKPFQPHITLVRRADLPRVELPAPPEVSMPVDHISVMRSDRLEGVLRYTEI